MIAIVKYNAGNIRSVSNALKRMGYQPVLTDNPEMLKKAEKVIFPGVGEAGSAMRYLVEKGMDKVLKELHQPFLGICLGLQLMCKHSEENNTPGLGIFSETVKKFPPKGKIPHIGWNDFTKKKGTLFEGVKTINNVYFVHSYYAETGPNTVAETNYLLPFSAALQKDNFYAVQFHPEKSAAVGEKILKNFLSVTE